MGSADDVAGALAAYEVGEELGRGGWGVVLAGRHRRLRRAVAIKQLPREFAGVLEPDHPAALHALQRRSCYGLELATDQFGPRRPGPKTEIEGLYLTGASTKWAHGVYGSMTGGVGTAGAVLGRALLREIRSGRVFGDPDRLPIHDADWDPLLACRRLAHKPRSHKRDYALERA